SPALPDRLAGLPARLRPRPARLRDLRVDGAVDARGGARDPARRDAPRWFAALRSEERAHLGPFAVPAPPGELFRNRPGRGRRDDRLEVPPSLERKACL